ncbi:MAG: metallophosphoesterase [Nitrososphaeraceae archaeon]
MFHKTYKKNKKGKDYIVGDIHGLYDPLLSLLDYIKFDYTTDRLFSVGDIIDRGPKSFECANLVYEKWFYPVLGNHEQMLVQSILTKQHDWIDMWIKNGGQWFKDEDYQLIVDLAHEFNKLPLAISVGNGPDRFNIVHAELHKPVPLYISAGLTYGHDVINFTNHLMTDDILDKWECSDKEFDNMVWGRDIISLRQNPETYSLYNSKHNIQYHHPNELSITYVGHSSVPHKPARIEQHIYLDTGGVFGKNKQDPSHPLTIINPSDQTFFSYHFPFKTITKHNKEEIIQYK